MMPAAKFWTISTFLIAAMAPRALAQRMDFSAPQTAAPVSAGRTVIDAQLHAADAKKPGGHLGGEESNSLYRRYLADIGKPVTQSGAAGPAGAPIGSGGH